MRAWNVDVVLIFTERGVGADNLRTWHNKFTSTGISQTCEVK